MPGTLSAQSKMLKKDPKAIYYSALALYLLAKYAEISTIYYTSASVGLGMRYIRLLSYAMIAVYTVLYTRFTREEIIKYMALISCVAIVSYTVHSVTLLAAFMFIFAAKDFDIYEVIRFVVVLQIITTIVIVAGCLAGIVPDWTYFISGRYRHSLGFFYPNRLSSIYFFIVIALFYLVGSGFNIIEIAGLEILNFVIFYFTNSRMAFALTTLALILFLFISVVDRMGMEISFNRKVYICLLVIIPLICIAACWIYKPSTMHLLSRINGLISNRIQMGGAALHTKPITLFGNINEWYGFGGLGYLYTQLAGEYNAVDCSFVKIFLDYGVLLWALIIIGYAMAAAYAVDRGDKYLSIAILLVFVYCMIEPNLIEIGFNPFVLCLSALVSPNAFKGRSMADAKSALLASYC